jgi:uncharacterized protein DUF3307
MDWPSLFVAFLVCHLAGDFLLQTDWQARHKTGGLGRDPVARRALWTHVAVYTLAFVPALAWVAAESSAWWALLIAAVVALPHGAIDDGRPVRGWLRVVKHSRPPYVPGLLVSVDQSLHVVCLLGAALLAVAT